MKQFLRYDYNAYLLCLATAASFWLLNAMGSDYETNIRYPVHFVPDSVSSKASIIKTGIQLNVEGSGWEILKRNIAFKFSPLELPLSMTKGKEFMLSKKLTDYILPDLGQLEFKSFVTDSLFLTNQTSIQKKVILSVDPMALLIRPPYRISNKIVLDPDYITVNGRANSILNLPDTLYVFSEEK